MGSGTPSTSNNRQEGRPRTSDAKTLRRLAQNREAARKSRLRKKVFILRLTKKASPNKTKKLVKSPQRKKW